MAPKLCSGCQVKPAGRLECPKCKSLGIPDSFFCDQACFNSNCELGNKHKGLHAMIKSLAASNLASSSKIPSAMNGYKFTGSMRPHYPLSPKRAIPATVERPDYADDQEGESRCERNQSPVIKILNADEIKAMRVVCKLAREVLDLTASHIRPGVTTDELDRICHEACVERDSYPSPLNYRMFPKSVCTSVNEVICHGIPDQRPLEEGDIINLDVSLYHGGMHADLNATYPVGKTDQDSLDLIAATKECMEAAIAMCKPGALFRDIGNTIDSVIKPKGYGIVRTYTGHGVHNLFHALPNIMHYAGSKTPGTMRPGMCFTIEPMINRGSSALEHWRDDWTAVTKDGKRSAQFEETMLITENGVEVLTRPGMSFP